MLETVREYGSARLTADGDRAAVMRRLTTWAADEAHRQWARSLGVEQAHALATLRADQETLTTAIRWALTIDDEHAAFAIGAPVMFGWTVTGLHLEVSTWARDLLHTDSVARRRTSTALAGAPARAARAHRAADADDLATVALLAMLNAAISGDLRTAALARRVGVRLLTDDLALLAHRSAALLRASGAIWRNDPALQLAAAARLVDDPDPYLQALGLFMRAGTRDNMGDGVQAMDDARASYGLFEQIGDPWGMAMAAQTLGQWHSGRGAPEAELWLTRAEEHLTNLGALQDARSLTVVRAVDLAISGDASARATLERTVASRSVDGATRSHALLGLSALAATEGAWDDAIELADAAVDASASAWTVAPQARVLYRIGAAMVRIYAGRDGATILASALTDAVTSRDAPILGILGLAHAELAARRGDEDQARELWALSTRLGAYLWMTLGHLDAAVLPRALGDAAAQAELRARADRLDSATAVARLTALLST